jgi:hypothetical protein
MELLFEPLIDAVGGAHAADGGDVFGGGPEGEAAEQVQNALVLFAAPWIGTRRCGPRRERLSLVGFDWVDLGR